MNENLIQASHSAKFVAEDLRRAMARATPVEVLVLLPMIGAAADLARQIDALIVAKNGSPSEGISGEKLASGYRQSDSHSVA